MHLPRRLRPLVPVLALAATGCASTSDPDGGSSTPGTNNPAPPATNADIAGTWAIEVTITNETGACAGSNEPPWNAVVSIAQSGSQVTAVSDWNSNPGSGPHTFSGTIAGRQLQLSGSYPESEGTLQARYDLTVAADGNSMSGTETWTWTAAGGSCPNSSSTVVATRNN